MKSNTIESTDSSKTDNPNEKWQCGSCTYLNWSKSMKCTICLTPKQTNQSSSTNENLTDLPSIKTSTIISNKSEFSKSNGEPKIDSIKFKKTHHVIKKNVNNNLIDNNLIDNEINLDKNSLEKSSSSSSSTVQQQIKFKPIKPSTSTDKPELNFNEHQIDNLNNQSSSNRVLLNDSLNSSSNSLNNDQCTNDKVIDNLQTTLNKWSCSQCTYLNWPKSMKCILCQTPKALNLTNNLTASNCSINSTNSNTPASTATTELSICSGGKQLTTSIVNNIDENTASKRNTPSPTIGACQRNRLNSNLNNNNINTIINYNLNSSIRRKNRDQYVDWIFLEACVGIVLNGKQKQKFFV